MPPRNNRGRGRGGGAAEGRRQPGGDGGGGAAEGRRQPGGDGGGGAAEGRRQPGGDGGGRAAEGRGGQGGGNAQAAAVPELNNFPTRDEIDPTKVSYLRVPAENDPENIVVWSKTYEKLILSFRKAIAPIEFCEVEGGEIRMLSNDQGPNAIYHLVPYYDNDNWIILFYRMADMYVIGFRNRYGSFRFSDANYDRMNPLPFSSRYISMENHSSSSITKIELGMAKLRTVVDHLSQLTIPNSRSRNPKVAAGLLVSVLMFAESSRFESIFNRIKNSSDDYFRLLNCHEFYIKNWSKLSKVLIAANERPEMIETINHAIEQGLHGLGDLSERRGLPLDDDGQYATNVEDVKSLVRVLSNQTIEESVALFGHQE